MSESAGAGPKPAGRRRGPRRWVAVVAVLGVLAGLAVSGLLYGGYRLLGNTTRIPGAFDGLADRPQVPTGAGEAVDILVVTRDDGAQVPATGSADPSASMSRGDMLMLVHLDGDRRGASVVWIPVGTLVEIPGHGTGRIDAAPALGGAPLLVATVERLTGVRLDHVAVTHWSRFAALADAVGGVAIEVPETVRDPGSGATWAAGRHVLGGAEMLRYVRQGGGLPGRGPEGIGPEGIGPEGIGPEGIERKRAVVRALMTTALQQEMRNRPLLLYRFLDTMTRGLAIDDTWSAWEGAALVASMRDVRSADIRYLVMPVTPDGAGTGLRPADQGRELWRAVAEDRVDRWEYLAPG